MEANASAEKFSFPILLFEKQFFEMPYIVAWDAVPKRWLLGFGALPHRTRCPGARNFSSVRRDGGNLAIHCLGRTKAMAIAHSLPRR